jgi:hypothetical protein
MQRVLGGGGTGTGSKGTWQGQGQPHRPNNDPRQRKGEEFPLHGSSSGSSNNHPGGTCVLVGNVLFWGACCIGLLNG